MLHCIIVKWKDGVKPDYDCIASLFEGVLSIDGIHKVRLVPNVVDRPNRYDLTIIVDMEPSALPLYDESEPHYIWKSRYGEMIASKAIFDADGHLPSEL